MDCGDVIIIVSVAFVSGYAAGSFISCLIFWAYKK